ncbi:MAG TPA: hypothetical protein VF245_06530 [Solirubrobacterales bacterium]
MTDARVEQVPADRVSAREYLAQGKLFFDDAVQGGLSTESRQVLLHQATICACDAILLAAGLRVSVGERGHVLRLETALNQLPEDTSDLFEALDASRAMRVEASYRALPVPAASADDAEEATRELYVLAEAQLAR